MAQSKFAARWLRGVAGQSVRADTPDGAQQPTDVIHYGSRVAAVLNNVSWDVRKFSFLLESLSVEVKNVKAQSNSKKTKNCWHKKKIQNLTISSMFELWEENQMSNSPKLCWRL